MSAEHSETHFAPLLPLEVIDQILSHLRISTLRYVRLVNRQWSDVATKHLFEYISMTPSVKGLSLWQTRLEDVNIGAIPTTAQFNTSVIPNFKPSYITGGSDVFQRVCSWQPYSYWLNGRREHLNADDDEKQRSLVAQDRERYEQFYNSFTQLNRLPALREVSLHFEPRWRNQKHNAGSLPPVEKAGFQELIISLLLQALSNRSQDKGNSTVKALCIENLQDVPLARPDCITDVLQKIETLKLVITEKHEDTEEFVENFMENRRSFLVHLKDDWLSPVSSRLRSLDLAFHGQWGSLSGEIRAKDIEFPALRKLRLERFAPADDASFDWILKTTSLETLMLHDCQIVSYIFLLRQQVEDWDLSVSSWQELTPVRFHDTDRSFFHYKGTWAGYFDRIGKCLPNLNVFRFDGSDYIANQNRHTFHIYHSRRSPIIMADSRYTSFDSAYGSSPWRSPGQDGDLWEIPPTQETVAKDIARKNFDLDLSALTTLTKLIKERRK